MLVLFLLLGEYFAHGQSAFPSAEMNSAKKFSIDLVQVIARGDAALIHKTFLSTIRVDSSKLGNAVRRYSPVLKTQATDTSIQQDYSVNSPYGPVFLTHISWIGSDSSELIRLSFNFVIRGTQFRLVRLDFISELPGLFAPDARRADSLNAIVVDFISKEDTKSILALFENTNNLDTALLRMTVNEFAIAMKKPGRNYTSNASNPMEVFPEYTTEMTYPVSNSWKSEAADTDEPHFVIYFMTSGSNMYISQISFSRGKKPKKFVQFPGGVYETKTIPRHGGEIPPPPPPPPPPPR